MESRYDSLEREEGLGGVLVGDKEERLARVVHYTKDQLKYVGCLRER